MLPVSRVRKHAGMAVVLPLAVLIMAGCRGPGPEPTPQEQAMISEQQEEGGLEERKLVVEGQGRSEDADIQAKIADRLIVRKSLRQAATTSSNGDETRTASGKSPRKRVRQSLQTVW
jgi:hypothetical protein